MSDAPRFRRVKITDVAQALNLSVSTVSRALNGYHDVSEDTRRRIAEQAERMGYTPSRIGLRLRKGRSHAAGFVVPPFGSDFADPVFLAVLAGADHRLRREGMQLLVTTAANEEDELLAIRRMIEGDQVDSMILVRVRRDDPRINYLHDQGVPFALLGRSARVASAPSVEPDTGDSVRVAVEHLAAAGAKRIAHLNAPGHFNYGYERAEAFRKATARVGLDASGQTELTGDLTELGGYNRTIELLDLDSTPDALICANDAMAIGALHALISRGRQPGRDMSIIGFGDIAVARLVTPALSTFHVPYEDLGARIADYLLLDLAGKNDGTLSYTHKPRLIIRGT